MILAPAVRPRLPAIMLSDHALALIRDVFANQNLFLDAPRIRTRMVAWGPDSKLLAVDHSGVVVSEEVLLTALEPVITSGESGANEWSIFASKPLPAPAAEHEFGSRVASIAPVRLREASRSEACWIEALEDGWLFLLANWLLSVGGSPETLLSRSRVIAAEIAERGETVGRFAAYPRISAPLTGPAWLACGTAAMAFDPLCGDGTAHAIREAVLAAAVIQAVVKGGPAREILAHYEARLTAGFERHLSLCRDYYGSGGGGAWWKQELAAIEQGIAWCGERLRDHGPFRYRLSGFELHALD